jgi:hypothetical protein
MPEEERQISPRMRKMLEKGRNEARQKVIERGIVQFRADPDLMEKLLLFSEKQKIPLGTMVRNWIDERLNSEQKNELPGNLDLLVDRLSEALAAKLDMQNVVFSVKKKRHEELTWTANAQLVNSNQQRREQIEEEQYLKVLEKVS